MLGFVLFSTESDIKARGEALDRFVSVTADAWEYIAHGNAAEATTQRPSDPRRRAPTER